MIDLSIIIPVYNVEKYIKKCLQSCVEQDITPNTYEIIIVNDGAIDNSLKIATEFAKNHSNIIIVSQENKGLGAARNTGLSTAQGKYVWFVDADDWIKENSLHNLLSILNSKNLDAITFNSTIITSENSSVIKKRMDLSSLNNKILSGLELMKTDKWQQCVPFTIYKKNFLYSNHLCFMEGIFHEDYEFTPRAFSFIKTIYILDEILYFVYANPTSITRSVNIKKSYDLITASCSLTTFYKSNISEKYAFIYQNIISEGINNAFSNALRSDKKNYKTLNSRIKENSFILENLRKSTILKYKLEGFLFFTIKGFYMQTYKFLKLFQK